MGEELVDARVAIAVLKTEYAHLSDRVGEIRDEMRKGMGDMNTKFDGMSGKFDLVIQGMREREATSKLRSRIVSALSHVATGGATLATLAAAKWLHVPISLG